MNNFARRDHYIIFDLVEPGSKILDLGCGNGELMILLARYKNVRVNGIEKSSEAIRSCVAKGLSVLQGDIESGLDEYPDASYDYVILNQSLQEVSKADYVITEALRIGQKAIIGFPNFAHVSSRFILMCRGRAPVTKELPHRWFDTPSLRFFSIVDFTDFCRKKGITILGSHYMGRDKQISAWPNLRALNVIYVVTQQ